MVEKWIGVRKDQYPSDPAIPYCADKHGAYDSFLAMRHRIGTWEWAEATHGRLSRRERATLIRQAVLARLSRMWVARGGGLAEEAAGLPDPPDTALARDAEQRVRELSPPALHGHCLRTWAFSALFAQRDRVVHDPELLYVACVLHDLGLTEAHDGRDPTAACFAVEGARAAHGFMCGRGEPEPRARTVANAISLHLNVAVPDRLGAEAALLSKGVTLDAIGARLDRLPRSAVAQVVDLWPRDGSGALLVRATRRQAECRPQSRSALLDALGFARLVEHNPLDAEPHAP
jgi:hypothetical protein